MDAPDTPPPDLPPVGWSADPLASPGAAGTLDDLRRVLRRHRRRQLRALAVTAAAVLVAGAAGGFAAGRGIDPTGTTRVAAASQQAGSQPAGSAAAFQGADGPGPSPGDVAPSAAVSASSAAYPNPGYPVSVQLLLRNATDGTRVRLYEQKFPVPTFGCPAGATCPLPPKASCLPTGSLSAEVSDDQVAGQAGGILFAAPKASGLDVVGAEVVGMGQPQPILTVTAHAGPDVARVNLTTPYGTDTMAPVSGWVALAVRLPASYRPPTPFPFPGSGLGTLAAFAASGATISSTSLSGFYPSKPPCEPTQIVCGGSATATGSTGPRGDARVTLAGPVPAPVPVPTTGPPPTVPCQPCPPIPTIPPYPPTTATHGPTTGPPTSLPCVPCPPPPPNPPPTVAPTSIPGGATPTITTPPQSGTASAGGCGGGFVIEAPVTTAP